MNHQNMNSSIEDEVRRLYEADEREREREIEAENKEKAEKDEPRFTKM